MTKYLLTSVFICSSIFCTHASASDITEKEKAAYIEGCKKGLSQAKTNFDAQDIEMLCSDPNLKGKPNESASDKSRRMRLIKKTNEDQDRMTSNATRRKEEAGGGAK